jgi:hypothetical protein
MLTAIRAGAQTVRIAQMGINRVNARDFRHGRYGKLLILLPAMTARIHMHAISPCDGPSPQAEACWKRSSYAVQSA